MKNRSILFIAAGMLLLLSCKKDADAVVPSSSSRSESQLISDSSSAETGNNQCNGQPKPGMPPKPEEILSKMDTDQDHLLSKREVSGPLANDFDKVDLNQDGFISLEELKKCPPPKKQ